MLATAVICLLIGLVVPYWLPPLSDRLGVKGSMVAIYSTMFGGPVLALAAILAAFSARYGRYRAAWGAIFGIVAGLLGLALEVLWLDRAYLGLLWLPAGIIAGWLAGSSLDRK